MEMNKAQTLNVYHVLHDRYEIYMFSEPGRCPGCLLRLRYGFLLSIYWAIISAYVAQNVTKVKFLTRLLVEAKVTWLMGREKNTLLNIVCLKHSFLVRRDKLKPNCCLKVWALEWSTGTAHQNLEQDNLPEAKFFSLRLPTVKFLVAKESNWKVF